jgi:hypothetical protein
MNRRQICENDAENEIHIYWNLSKAVRKMKSASIGIYRKRCGK